MEYHQEALRVGLVQMLLYDKRFKALRNKAHGVRLRLVGQGQPKEVAFAR